MHLRTWLFLGATAAFTAASGSEPLAPISAAASAPPVHQFEIPNRKVTLLLPISSEHGAAARAVRDGYLWAYYGDHAKWPVTIVDTHGSTDQAVAAYHTAVTEGATLIVGPLMKSGLDAVVRQAKRSVQTLALNYDDSAAAVGIYTFGLAPEDEADEAARSASRLGLRRAALLTSGDDWGRRIGAAFRQTFESSGGRIVDAGSYDPEAYDFSEIITKLLKVVRTASGGHSRRFHRRQDVDVIFVSARAEVSRMLIPQLHFFGASNLPIYATSEVNDGTIQGHYRERLRFCTMPVVADFDGPAASLRTTLLEAFPDADAERLRLMAFGHDAYQLGSLLELHGQLPSAPIPAASGTLSVNSVLAVRRHLPCVEIAGRTIRRIEHSGSPVGQ